METIEQLQEALGPVYEIERQVGLGGAARVFLARDAKHNRRVAIKVLLESVAWNLGVGRFLQEIQFAARLTHPHILPLLDSGYAGGLPYYVMPYIEGETLRNRLERAGPVPVGEAVRVVQQVADALEYAHAAGIVHRDVKPENVLLMRDHALILDFGVARAMLVATEDRGGTVTSEGLVVGTPAYVSPEQASGELTIDGRSDQYSLALMLFEMLAGEMPFRGPTLQSIVAQRFTAAPPLLSSVRPDIPAAISRAVDRALSLNPQDRFAGVGEFARVLDEEATNARALRGAVTARGDQAPSVAVLPFAISGGNAEDEYLAEGITDAVINTLARCRTIRVAARSSCYTFRGAVHDVAAVGRKLGVQSVVEGTVQRVERRVRVSAALVNVSDGFQLWADRFDRDLDDIFAIQDEISGAISRSLEGALGLRDAAAITGVRANSVEAYECYMRGRYHWNRRTESGLEEARTQFERAVARDPVFALAQAGLADVFAVLGTYGARPPRDAFRAARDHAGAALRLDPSLGEAHATLGLVAAVYDRDWDAAEAAFRRSLTLSPSYPTAHQWRAVAVLAPLGRTDEALAALERARALDPLSLAVGASFGVVLALGRRHEEAVARHREVLALEPGFAIGWFFLGQALLGAGRAADACVALDRAAALAGTSQEIVAVRACAAVSTGDTSAGVRGLAALQDERSRRYVPSALLAQVAAALGQADQAMTWLRESVAAREPEAIYLAVRPSYDPLRAVSGFDDLIAQAGLGRV